MVQTLWYIAPGQLDKPVVIGSSVSCHGPGPEVLSLRVFWGLAEDPPRGCTGVYSTKSQWRQSIFASQDHCSLYGTIGDAQHDLSRLVRAWGCLYRECGRLFSGWRRGMELDTRIHMADSFVRRHG